MQLSNLYLRIFACLHVKDVIFHIFIKVNKSDIANNTSILVYYSFRSVMLLCNHSTNKGRGFDIFEKGN